MRPRRISFLFPWTVGARRLCIALSDHILKEILTFFCRKATDIGKEKIELPRAQVKVRPTLTPRNDSPKIAAYLSLNDCFKAKIFAILIGWRT
jgi:hypothetical protein